jgi:hypothetical protein
VSIPLALSLDRQPASNPGVRSPLGPAATIPALAPDPSDEQSDPPQPLVGSDADSFELAFETADGVIGRFVWQSPRLYEGLRITANGDPTLDYNFEYISSEGGYFWDVAPVKAGAVLALPEDPVVPWALLIEQRTIDEMWTAIGGTGPPTPADITHPLADSGFAADQIRLEVSQEHIPVLVESPTIGSWQVTSLQHRPVRSNEILNDYFEIAFDYALYQTANTSDEQRTVIADGMVTFADYQDASARTADCARVDAGFDDATGLFSFDNSPRLEACRTQHLDDIEDIWRIDSGHVDHDELRVFRHTAEGNLEFAEMFKVEPGPRLRLASGPGWEIDVWERGEGVCISAAFQCGLPSGWAIPEVLEVLTSHFDEGAGRLVLTGISGLAASNVTRLLVTFESGDTIEIIPGETATPQLGIRGFGLGNLDPALGEPTTIEAFANEKSLGVYYFPVTIHADGNISCPDHVSDNGSHPVGIVTYESGSGEVRVRVVLTDAAPDSRYYVEVWSDESCQVGQPLSGYDRPAPHFTTDSNGAGELEFVVPGIEPGAHMLNVNIVHSWESEGTLEDPRHREMGAAVFTEVVVDSPAG